MARLLAMSAPAASTSEKPDAPGATDRPEPWFWIAWLVGAVATAVPIFTPAHVPFLDWPQHAAMVAVLADYGDPARGFERYYELHPQVSTYLSFYYAGALLAKLVGVDLAMRILTVVSMVTTPLATASLARSLGRSRWPALLAFVPAWSWPLYMGFTTYVLAVPLALWTVAALIRLTDRDDDAPKRGVFVEVVIASTLLFFTHALAYGAALAVAGLALAVFHHWSRFRRLLRALAAIAPSLLAMTYWLVRQWTGSAAARSGTLTATVHGQSEGGIEPHPFERKIPEIPTWFNEAFRDDRDTTIATYWVYAFGFALAFGLGAVAWRTYRERPDARTFLASLPWRAMLVAALFAGLYFVIPMSAGNIWALSPRMIVLGACAGTLVVPRLVGRPALDALALAPALALTLYAAWVNHAAFRSGDQDARDLSAVLAHAEPGQRLYGLVYSSGDDVMAGAVHLHDAAYYMVERGGLTGFTFVHVPTIPLRLRTLGEGPYPGRRGEWEHDRFRFPIYGDFYDYFLTRGGGASLPARLGAPIGALELLHSEGSWALYRNTRPRRTLVQSFGETLHEATARIAHDGTHEACEPWNGRGLVCPGGEWMTVGPSEQAFSGRRAFCVWAHPPGPGAALELLYENVPNRGDHLTGFAGVADSGQREGAPDVTLRAFVDGTEVGVVEAGARPGAHTFDFALPPSEHPRRVRFRISAPSDGARHFCFGAQLFASDGPDGR
ncbi:MAG: hypothetical protein H6722_23525 [Sandaracinus sp.]|nr:hypothetical protein [Sandaracinus sp.]